MGQVKKAAALFAVAAAALAPAAPAGAAPRFERCGSFGFQCARVSVPLDHSGAVPGRVSLFVKRIRAREQPRRGAVFALAGGPGESATASFGAGSLGLLEPAYRNRDLILFDQRGTGRSGLLRCRALERASLLRSESAAGTCARRLGARRFFYTSRDSVADLEAIRRALGVRRVTLFGTSYGTKVALGYALAHPESVERLVLDSVVEAAGPDALYLDTLQALPRALRAVCRSGCRRFTRDPVGDLQALVARIAREPLSGRLVDERGRGRRKAVRRTDLFYVLLAGDFNPLLRAAFPAAVRSGLAGDAAPLLRLRRIASRQDASPLPPRLLSTMLYAATSCEETRFPWARTTPPDPALRRAEAARAAAALPDSAFRPFDRATMLETDLIELCGRWPAAAQAPDFSGGPLPDVPVLLVQGEDDLRTPVENARRVAALFPQSRLLVAPNTGHSVVGFSRCVDAAFQRFMQDKRFSTSCRGEKRGFPPDPPAPLSLDQLAPRGGVSGPRGRVLTAVALTLRDVTDDLLTRTLAGEPHGPGPIRGGGLRAGRYRGWLEETVRLTRLAFVPGVRLSGRVSLFGLASQRGRIRVAGARGVPGGLLALRGERLSGVLGGRRVRASHRNPFRTSSADAAVARLGDGPLR
jgi:pimeloyl-ACP methyl ester carboxylesterase